MRRSSLTFDIIRVDLTCYRNVSHIQGLAIVMLLSFCVRHRVLGLGIIINTNSWFLPDQPHKITSNSRQDSAGNGPSHCFPEQPWPNRELLANIGDAWVSCGIPIANGELNV